ncbi:hypothetical protein PanWU01x14_367270, partial [Parasponia andersonii]
MFKVNLPLSNKEAFCKVMRGGHGSNSKRRNDYSQEAVEVNRELTNVVSARAPPPPIVSPHDSKKRKWPKDKEKEASSSDHDVGH